VLWERLTEFPHLSEKCPHLNRDRLDRRFDW